MAREPAKSFFQRWGVHLAVLLIVIIWTIPTLGILVSSLRDKDQIAVSGWWTALTTSSQTGQGRTAQPTPRSSSGGAFVISGQLFEEAIPAAHHRRSERAFRPRLSMRPGAVAELATA
jgi:alpha-glucoside transport system permease protein